MERQCRITVELDEKTTYVSLGPRLGATIRCFLVLLDTLSVPDADYTIRLDLDEPGCERSLCKAA